MLKKIVLGTLLVGLIGALTFGAVNRTIAKSEQTSGVAAEGRGQGRGLAERIDDEHVASAQNLGAGRGQGQGGGQGRGNGTGEGSGLGQGNGSGEGSGYGQGNGTGEGSGYGQGSGTGERQYPNNEAAPSDWTEIEGVVAQAPAAGIDLIVTTTDGSEVQIGTGPNWLASQGFELAVGDQVQATGYWEDDEFKAAQLTRLSDGASIALRDAQGRPAWAGQGRRAQANATTH